MKKTTLYFLLIIAAFASSCRKDKAPVFDKDADDRTDETLSKYQAVLTGATNGWTGTVTTKVGNIYSFYFRFNDNNRVLMYCDLDTATAGTLKESSFRLKALQQPSLLFDTYSYIHLLADPDPNVIGGIPGAGLVSDFEFSIDSLTADSILLTGRFNGSSAVLRKASQQDRAAWESGQVRTTLDGLAGGRILNYWKRLSYNGTEYEIRLNTLFKTAFVTWKDASGTPHVVTTSYYVSAAGFQFVTPIVNGSNTIKGFTVTGFNEATATLKVSVNNTDALIAGAIKPIVPDVNAAKRWWNVGAVDELPWLSYNGFHVNGVNDAYGMNTLRTDTSRFYTLVYWAGIVPPSGPAFDELIPFYLTPASNSLNWIYGTGQQAKFQSDGRIVFTYLGDLNKGPYPTSGPAFKTKQQLFITEGYWFVQTSESSYDMVSAKDAKAWVRWELEQ